jgi:hypothetical protein
MTIVLYKWDIIIRRRNCVPMSECKKKKIVCVFHKLCVVFQKSLKFWWISIPRWVKTSSQGLKASPRWQTEFISALFLLPRNINKHDFDALKENHHFANSTLAIMALFAITNHHWPIYWMICFIQFVRLSFPYWIWRRVILYTQFRLRAHGGCDRSAEDAHSSLAPDPTFAFVGVPYCPTLDFVIVFWTMVTFYALLTSLFSIWICVSNI